MKTILLKGALWTMAAALLSTANAAEPFLGSTPGKPVLPDLPSPSGPPTGQLSIDARHALLGFRSNTELWTVRVNYGNAATAALNVDYGIKLNNKLAIGTNLNVAGRRQDLVLNTFFVPAKDIRLHVAGGQLLQRNEYAFLSGVETAQVQQNNFLIDVRKSWNANTVIQGLAVTAYGASAYDRTSLFIDNESADGRALATGSLEGYRLNLTLAPTILSRLELNHAVEQVHYAFADGSEAQQLAESYEARYIRQLDKCAHLHGGYRAAMHYDRFDVGIRRRAWNAGFSQTTRRDSDNSDVTFHINYAIPLAADRGRPVPCAGIINTPPPSTRIISHIAHRPGQLPSAALARVDPTAPLQRTE
jgi:hypothetical protein